LQKTFRSKLAKLSLCLLTISLFATILPKALNAQVIRKTSVTFKASDGLLVSADLYQSKKSNPYIVLAHTELSCKSEFDSIVSRFIKMNYNCLAVDLRSGSDIGFYKNETANRAKEEGFLCSLDGGILDLEAAINYIFELSGKKVNVFGSGASASIALIVAYDNENIKAVVAFSPGEYFEPDYQLKSILANYPKPVFVACTTSEYAYLSEIEGFPDAHKILFKPATGEGLHGTKALFRENPSRDEYWLSLLIFFKSFQL